MKTKCSLLRTLDLTCYTSELTSQHELSDLSFTYSSNCISRYRKSGLLCHLEHPTTTQESMLPNLSRTSMAGFCYMQVLHTAGIPCWDLETRGLGLDSAYCVSAVHRQDPTTVQEQKTMGH